MRIFKITSLLFLTILLTCCAGLTGREIGRIPMDAIADPNELTWKTTKLDLKSGERLWFWTDMDVVYDGDLVLEYQVEIIKGSDTLERVKLRPFDKQLSLMEKQVSVPGHTDWSFLGKMDSYDVKESGTYTFRAVLLSNSNENVHVNKADLVFKK